MLTDFLEAKLEFCTPDKYRQKKKKKKGKRSTPKYVLIHLLKIVMTSSRKLGHSLELDDLAL